MSSGHLLSRLGLREEGSRHQYVSLTTTRTRTADAANSNVVDLARPDATRPRSLPTLPSLRNRCWRPFARSPARGRKGGEENER